MILSNLLTDPSEVVSKVCTAIDKRHLLLLTYLNQHSFNIYSGNGDYRNLLDTKFTVYQADQGMFLALKYLFGKKINKIDATAMNQQILDELIQKQIPLVIVGGNFNKKFVCDESKTRGINLVYYRPGYFGEAESESIINEINNLDNRVIILAMGVPRQEFFAYKISRRTDSKLIICVGNFFEFYFGTKKRAPVFIQKIGFEWLFRLMTEPGRLWKRYLIGIPVFFYNILKVKFSEKRP